MTPLCELAKKYGTDKGGAHLIAGEMCHDYCPVYHEIFRNHRDKVKRVLEVGVNTGASLRMWEEYFPNAEIIGLDHNPACLFNAGRIRCFEADQGDSLSLIQALVEMGSGNFDLIVDDGSHDPVHQYSTANILLQHLAQGGCYVIEDIPGDRVVLVMDFISWPKEQMRVHMCGPGLGRTNNEPLLVIRNV